MLLKVENLCCGYKKEVIVENVSFNLSEGEILFLFGPNGVGKTTFFKTLLGLLKAIDGKILDSGIALVVDDSGTGQIDIQLFGGQQAHFRSAGHIQGKNSGIQVGGINGGSAIELHPYLPNVSR